MPVKIDGLAAGEEARIVVAAVDVGILNLTSYKPPAPDDYYLGQRRLTAEIRDLYGQLHRRHAGHARRRSAPAATAPAPSCSGSRRPSRRSRSIPASSRSSRDGTAEVAFDIPAFTGTVRVMAVAWTKDKVGRASATSSCAIRWC